MNKIVIEIRIEDKKLLNTLFHTIEVESEATKTDRGSVRITRDKDRLRIQITASDYVAARAMTNSIMRLVKASVDVATSVIVEKKGN